MAEHSLSSCVKQLSEYNHREFIKSLHFNESNENNLKMLMKVTNYYRQVLPVHVLTSQNIRARSVLLAEKYKYYKEDLERLKCIADDASAKSEDLSNKLLNVQTKHHDLINRVDSLISNVKIRETLQLSGAELQFRDVLENINGKTVDFKSNMANLNVKLNSLKKYSDQANINQKELYFQDWQMDLIKNNLSCLGENVQTLFNELSLIDEVIDNEVID